MSVTLSRPGEPCPIRAGFSRQVTARLDADPLVQRCPTDHADIFHSPNFLSRSDCRNLIRMIDADLHPSKILSTNGDPEYRTSMTCDLDRNAPDVNRLDARLSALLGIPFEYGETVQGQRYETGQQFRPHCDYFREEQEYWPAMEAQGGQRTWTAMIYLNDVEDGGATWFLHAGVSIRPTRGLLLAWNNMRADGSPNPYAAHEGSKVGSGVKYVITKWFRERPWVQRPAHGH